MTVKGVILGLMLLGAGILSICGAALNWDSLFESKKTQFFVKILGRNGARGFYGVLGVVVAVMGVLMALGLISAERKRKRFGFTESNVEQRSSIEVASLKPLTIRRASEARPVFLAGFSRIC